MRTKGQRSPLILWLIVGLLLTQWACQTVMGGIVPVPTATPLLATATPLKSPIPPADLGTGQGQKPSQLNPPYLPTTAPGVACVGTFGFGVTCIEGAEWHTYSSEEGDFGSDLIQAMTVCPDGSVLAAHTLGLGRYNDREWRSYEKGWGVSSADALACGADNRFWVAHFRGVSRFAAGEWQTYPAQEYLTTAFDANELLEDITITASGDVWAVTSNTVAWFTGDQWTVFGEDAGFDDLYFFANVTLDAQGRPWVSSSRGLFVFDGATWTAFPNNDYITPQALAVDAEGRVWVGTMTRGLYVLNPDGSWSTYNRENSPLSSNNVRDIIIDGQGRMWIGTAWGLNIIVDDDWHTYRMDNAGLADQDIYGLAVVNGGPTLPEPETKAPGSLSGQIADSTGKGIAHTAIEICVEKLYQDDYESSPCSDQPFFRSTTADAEGRFSFADLPAGRYVLVVNDDARWIPITDQYGMASERFLVTSGENTELGKLALKAEE